MTFWSRPSRALTFLACLIIALLLRFTRPSIVVKVFPARLYSHITTPDWFMHGFFDKVLDMWKVCTNCFFHNPSLCLFFLALLLVAMVICHMSDRLSRAWDISFFSFFVASWCSFLNNAVGGSFFLVLKLFHEYGSQVLVSPGIPVGLIA